MYSVLYSPHVVNWRVLDLLHAHGPALALCDLGASLMRKICATHAMHMDKLLSPTIKLKVSQLLHDIYICTVTHVCS